MADHPRLGAVEVAALLGFVVLVAATLIGLKLDQPAAFGAAWFLLWLVPGVGIFPSDHYHSGHTLYLAIWGLAFAVAQGLFLLWRPVGQQLVPGSEAVVFVPLILLLGIISGSSSMRWWDHTRLFESEIASDPHYMEGRLELAKAAVEKATPVSHSTTRWRRLKPHVTSNIPVTGRRATPSSSSAGHNSAWA
ncbi:MAG: hypothetical protein H6962_06805 [Chromatiaceae bacterium]|nr:hypothetical protein [Chromatiaceae bacterium]